MIKDTIKKIIEKLLYIRSEFLLRRHINKIYRRLRVKKNSKNEELVKKHKQYWGQLTKRVNPKWFYVYSYITNNPEINYVPENIYFNIIEPKLNNRKLVYAYGDKNFYEIFYDNKDIFPESIIRNIDGLFYSKKYNLLNIDEKLFNDCLQKYNKIIIKPSVDSSGGKNIQLFKRENGNFIDSKKQILSLKYLINFYKDNYIIQDYIQQNEWLAQFNKSSVNTIRIFTYRSVITDEVFPLHAVLRIGKAGNYIDDQNVGGIACKINDDCSLNDFATDICGRKYYENNAIVFSEIKRIPKVQEMKDNASFLAKKNIHSRLMGFDFTLDNKDRVKLIEINYLWIGINFFQMNSSSVFGKYTDEIIQFCRNNQRLN